MRIVPFTKSEEHFEYAYVFDIPYGAHLLVSNVRCCFPREMATKILFGVVQDSKFRGHYLVYSDHDELDGRTLGNYLRAMSEDDLKEFVAASKLPANLVHTE